MARAGQSFRSTLNTVLSKRLFHSPVPSSRHPIGLVSSLVGDVMSCRPMSYAAVRLVAGGGAARPNLIRCRINRLVVSLYSNSGSVGGFSDRPPTGCDDEYWLVVMDKSGRENYTKEQRIDCYIKTLAKVVGSEEEATKRIYSGSCERYFGCEIDKETANKLKGLPEVFLVLPDPYGGAEKRILDLEVLDRIMKFQSGFYSKESSRQCYDMIMRCDMRFVALLRQAMYTTNASLYYALLLKHVLKLTVVCTSCVQGCPHVRRPHGIISPPQRLLQPCWIE